MAWCYASLILEQSEICEPYQVAGLSFGGAVALEVCQQLVRRGKKATAIMLDTVCPQPGHLKLPDATVVPEKHVMGKLREDLDQFYQIELRNNERILNDYDAKQHGQQCAPMLRVVLLKAQGLDGTSRALRGLEDLQNGWGWLHPEMYSVPGSHFTICEPGYAERTSAAIRFVLGGKPVKLSSLSDLWFHAVRHGDSFLYTRLLKHPEFAECWIHDEAAAHHMTALQMAAENDDVFLAKLLLTKGARMTSNGKHAVDSALNAASFRTFSLLSLLSQRTESSTELVLDDFGDRENKKQLEIFSRPVGAAERRGQPWLRTLKAMNASGDSTRHHEGPMGEQLHLLQQYS
eukprot:g16188.t1